jgi:hypothetical protein
VESNLGYLEYELCKYFNVTPKGLGDLRAKDPNGVYFVESHMIHRWNEEAKAMEEAKHPNSARGYIPQ